jgi:hypothetical protein
MIVTIRQVPAEPGSVGSATGIQLVIVEFTLER